MLRATLPGLLAAASVAALMSPRRRPPRVVRDAGTGSASAPAAAFPVATAAAAGLAASVMVGGAFSLPAGAVVAAATWAWTRRLETPASRRRRELIEARLPHAVDLLAACLRAGRSTGSAVATVTAALEPGPLQEELSTVLARLRIGADPVDVWRSVGQDPRLGRLGRCVSRALDSGASVADAMVRLAEDLRRDSRAEVEARARAVGVRSTLPLGVCMLPAFVLVGVVPLVAGSLGPLLRG